MDDQWNQTPGGQPPAADPVGGTQPGTGDSGTPGQPWAPNPVGGGGAPVSTPDPNQTPTPGWRPEPPTQTPPPADPTPQPPPTQPDPNAPQQTPGSAGGTWDQGGNSRTGQGVA